MMWEVTRNAVERSVKLIEATWIQNGMAIAKTGNYARSIHAIYPADDEGFAGVVVNTAPYAAALEYGLPPFDMKPFLLASKFARVGKGGQRYLRIPFRHGTPGAVSMPAMPREIYERARRLKPGQQLPLSAAGKQWGQRTKLNPVGPYTWKTGLYAGMTKRGIKGHSQYMTFRTVSDNSPASAWWHPGIKEKRIAWRTAEQVVPQIERMLTAALDNDIEKLFEKVV